MASLIISAIAAGFLSTANAQSATPSFITSASVSTQAFIDNAYPAASAVPNVSSSGTVGLNILTKTGRRNNTAPLLYGWMFEDINVRYPESWLLVSTGANIRSFSTPAMEACTPN